MSRESYDRTLAAAYGMLDLVTTFAVRFQSCSTYDERRVFSILLKEFCGQDRALEAAISQFATQLEYIDMEEDPNRHVEERRDA